MKPADHEAYFDGLAPEIRDRLERIRAAVEAAVPGTTRVIAYQLPALKKRRVFFYFAAFKHHVGVYPPVTDDVALITETARYRGPKGNLSFPHKEPLPVDLIARVAMALDAQYTALDAHR